MPNRLSGPVQRSFVLSSGIEPVIFCLLSKCVNHYTMEDKNLSGWEINLLLQIELVALDKSNYSDTNVMITQTHMQCIHSVL